MRNEDELSERVQPRYVENARARAVSPSAGVQWPLDVAETSHKQRNSRWERLRLLLPQPEMLEVASRAVKGWVVTPAMGLTLFLAFGSALGFMYNRMSDQITAKDKSYQEQHDLLIEIRTELKINKEHGEQERQRLEHQIGDLAAWQQVTNKDLARVIPWRAPTKVERNK